MSVSLSDDPVTITLTHLPCSKPLSGPQSTIGSVVARGRGRDRNLADPVLAHCESVSAGAMIFDVGHACCVGCEIAKLKLIASESCRERAVTIYGHQLLGWWHFQSGSGDIDHLARHMRLMQACTSLSHLLDVIVLVVLHVLHSNRVEHMRVCLCA